VNDALAPELTSIPYSVMWALGLFTPLVKELRTTRYQFTRPFAIDSRRRPPSLDLKPITLEVARRDAAARLRGPTARKKFGVRSQELAVCGISLVVSLPLSPRPGRTANHDRGHPGRCA
jgi:hypothetical protein